MAPIIIISMCFFLLLIASSSTACDRCVHQSKISAFSSASLLQSGGSCGYGSMSLTFNGGHIAAAGPKVYKDGARCGACYQVRCKNQNFCTKQGTIVMVTDLSTSNQTDFVVSSGTLRAMANMGNNQDILELVKNNLDVEYKRVPCEHGTRNLSIRVEESSQRPSHLEVTFLNQGGQTEIIAVDVAQVGFPKWSFMSRSSRGGAIWETSKVVPNGPLQFRLVVTAGFDGKWYWASNALPADWESGMIYDSGIQITDIAQEPDCYPCDDGSW